MPNGRIGHTCQLIDIGRIRVGTEPRGSPSGGRRRASCGIPVDVRPAARSPWEQEVGAVWEPLGALNCVELHPTAPNGYVRRAEVVFPQVTEIVDLS